MSWGSSGGGASFGSSGGSSGGVVVPVASTESSGHGFVPLANSTAGINLLTSPSMVATIEQDRHSLKFNAPFSNPSLKFVDAAEPVAAKPTQRIEKAADTVLASHARSNVKTKADFQVERLGLDREFLAKATMVHRALAKANSKGNKVESDSVITQIAFSVPEGYKVWVNGKRTTGKVASLQYFTDERLREGQSGDYRIQAMYRQNGKRVIVERNIKLLAGEFRFLDFSSPAMANSLVRR